MLVISLFIILMLVFAIIFYWPTSGLVLLGIAAVIALCVLVHRIVEEIRFRRIKKQMLVCQEQGQNWKAGICQRCGKMIPCHDVSQRLLDRSAANLNVVSTRTQCAHDYEKVSTHVYQNTPGYMGDCNPPNSEVTVYQCSKCGDSYTSQYDY